MRYEEKLHSLYEATERGEDVFDEIRRLVKRKESKLKENSYYCDDPVQNGMLAVYLQVTEVEDFTFIDEDIPSLYFLYAQQLLKKDKLDEAIQYTEKCVEMGKFRFDYLLFLLDLYQMKQEHELVVFTFHRLYEAASDSLQLATYYVLFGKYMMDNEDYHFALCMFEYSQRICFLDTSEHYINELLKKGNKRPTQKEVEQFLKKDIVETNGSYFAIAGRYVAANWAKEEGEYQEAYGILSEIDEILGSDPDHRKELKDALDELQKEALKAGDEVVMHREINSQRMMKNIPRNVYLCTSMVKGSKPYEFIHTNDRVFLKENGNEIGVYTFRQHLIGCVPKRHEEIVRNLILAGFNLYGIVDSVTGRVNIRIYLTIKEDEEEQVLMA